ncbi:hypothetical protein DACRYDRAFT_102774 [Dacryopinax primogenitus]|uniref:Golgi apparatus membrane protein TVP38 n=1 Tax=Dacryopinax primogenitus (strain DJM 731) TaxID=1858805 RepID=M5FQ40_DACPD|nr:uncharacterized protein DACRYDRAFT_102774 [Dacryopinax primogenitus]EJT96704.1 hypothetical protein DACRYDRAFT_102774 [Dacryopinax primogenitus]
MITKSNTKSKTVSKTETEPETPRAESRRQRFPDKSDKAGNVYQILVCSRESLTKKLKMNEDMRRGQRSLITQLQFAGRNRENGRNKDETRTHARGRRRKKRDERAAEAGGKCDTSSNGPSIRYSRVTGRLRRMWTLFVGSLVPERRWSHIDIQQSTLSLSLSPTLTNPAHPSSLSLSSTLPLVRPLTDLTLPPAPGQPRDRLQVPPPRNSEKLSLQLLSPTSAAAADAVDLDEPLIDWAALRCWRTYCKWCHWPKYAVLFFLLATSVPVAIEHKPLVDLCRPWITSLGHMPAGWLIPIVILFIISFPPLFGHEIIAVLVGLVWGFGLGFAIVAVGTVLGEVGNFYAFRYLLSAKGHRAELTNLRYATLARIIRDGGFTIALVTRLSAVPGHLTTAVFSTCGMGIGTFVLAAALSMPKQMVTVYLGVVLLQSADGHMSPKNKALSAVVILVTVLVTIFAALWIYWKMSLAYPVVVGERRVAREERRLRGVGGGGAGAGELEKQLGLEKGLEKGLRLELTQVSPLEVRLPGEEESVLTASASVTASTVDLPVLDAVDAVVPLPSSLSPPLTSRFRSSPSPSPSPCPSPCPSPSPSPTANGQPQVQKSDIEPTTSGLLSLIRRFRRSTRGQGGREQEEGRAGLGLGREMEGVAGSDLVLPLSMSAVGAGTGTGGLAGPVLGRQQQQQQQQQGEGEGR